MEGYTQRNRLNPWANDSISSLKSESFTLKYEAGAMAILSGDNVLRERRAFVG